MKKRGQLQIPFSWLFAIIIGSVILFLAIFAVTRIFQTEQIAVDAQTAKEIGILLGPLETGFEVGITTSMILPQETRIHNRCNNKNNFGRQIIKVSQKSFGKWTEPLIDVGFSNKHIFSENFTEGRKFYLFSKPFNFPFKIADTIYITSSKKKYCFSNIPSDLERIENEILNLNQENLFIEGIDDCPDESVMVCFDSGSDCDITVKYTFKYVEKDNDKMYFNDDALMYAAIFSDLEVYECQLKRLMQRGEQLALLYKAKAEFVSQKGCTTNLGPDLLELSNLFQRVSQNNSQDILDIVDRAKRIETKNELASCKLW